MLLTPSLLVHRIQVTAPNDVEELVKGNGGRTSPSAFALRTQRTANNFFKVGSRMLPATLKFDGDITRVVPVENLHGVSKFVHSVTASSPGLAAAATHQQHPSVHGGRATAQRPSPMRAFITKITQWFELSIRIQKHRDTVRVAIWPHSCSRLNVDVACDAVHGQLVRESVCGRHP